MIVRKAAGVTPFFMRLSLFSMSIGRLNKCELVALAVPATLSLGFSSCVSGKLFHHDVSTL
jgi:hypothetical protein